MSDERAAPGHGAGGRPPRRWRIVRRLVLITGLLLLAFGALTVWQAWSAYGHLSSAADRAPLLRAQLVEGAPKLETTAAGLARDADGARRALEGPHWTLLTRLPRLGDDVEALRRVTVAVDELASEALQEMVAARGVVSGDELTVSGGRIDLDVLNSTRPHLQAADRSVRRASSTLAQVRPEGLLVELRTAYVDLRSEVAELGRLTQRAATAADLLVPMLGAEAPREYLVLVQNNAEPRALGGIPGSWIELKVEDGRLALGGQRPAFQFTEPVLPLTSSEVELFGTQLGRYAQNVTATPHFPRAAELAREMWFRETGGRVDGVLAVDPVVLGMLLEVAGPVTLPDLPLVRQVGLADGRRLNGENAARTLLSRVYLDIEDPKLQNRFFALSAAAIFRQLTDRELDLMAAADVFTDPRAAGRVLVWSAHRPEQDRLAEFEISGRLTGERDGTPVVGVYVHDRSASKIGYYQDLDVQVRAAGCNGAGLSTELDVRIALRAQTPEGIEDYPAYVSGAGGDVPAGTSRPGLYVYAPLGGVIGGVASERGSPFAMASGFHNRLHVAFRTVTLKPREQLRLRVRVRLREPARTVEIRVTPGAQKDRNTFEVSSCDFFP